MQILLAFVLGVCVGPAMSVVVPVTMGHHWEGGFEGKFCIPFSVDVTSWKAHLQFSEPVTKLEIWLAEIESQTPDGREFVLVNKPFNGNEHVGDSLCINFNGHGNGDINPTVNLTVDLPLPTTTQTTTTTTASPTTPTTTRTLAPGETWPPTTEPITPLHKRHNITSQMKLSQHYGTTWEGEFCFDLKVEIVAWELDIHFSQETKSLNNYDGDFISDTTSCTKHAVLVNKNTKGVHYGGSNYCVRMTGQVCGGGVPTAYAVLVDVTNDDQTVPRVPLVQGAQATKYNYGEILMKSILFYEAQRSGKLPPDNRIPWRGDSALGDKGSGGEDLTGGWYDAGDNVKFNFPMAFSTTLLTWSLIRYKDAYNATGQLEDMYECIKWPLDYFIKCHTKPNELWVQVGNGGTDHGSWTSPERMTMSRPAYKIDTSSAGSDIAMETASAMAAGSIAFKDKDPAYSAILLKHAKELFDFGKNNQAFYSASVSAAAGFYTSQNFTDENSWGGMWLYKATGDKAYLDYAELHHIGVAAWGFSWDEKVAGANMLLYEETKKDLYKKDIEDTFTMWFPGGDVPYSPKCMAFRLQWGALRYAANTAFIALVAADNGLHTEEYRKWAMSQLHYAYGDTGRSYIVGFGVNPPVKPHHRASSCPMLPAPCGWDAQLNKGPNPHTLYGAMVGGPGQSDDYTDSRMDYVKNEVACDYNAGMHASTAALEHLALTHELPTTYKDICP
ncbi:endoglucanase 4-like [Haliotis rufescens]|uniref:endoglucanase 4-like n=1 Tax=Haliotis rufescens TaxID=6454 RepID=UPI00201F3C5F|nr:endoglucanase 4-like [Haliotis rufescens]